MEKLFLIYFVLFVIRILLSPFLKIRMDVLNCGLFGYNGSQPPDLNALKILGFSNDSRGRDSCGYYYNNRLIHGVGINNTFYKLMQSQIIDVNDTKYFTFIGHTRFLTTGAATVENAHPFNINEKWIIAHNGTLDNWRTLCAKYNIDITGVNVDSKALGYLIDKVGFDILDEYIGYAALLMTDRSEPDSLYVYHGESKTLQNGQPEKERPLWYMEVENGVYFSSLKEPLLCIRKSETEVPEELNYNWVFKVKNGVIDTDNATWINRIESNVGINFTTATQKTTTPVRQIQYVPQQNTTNHPLITGTESGGIDINKESLPVRVLDFPHKERIIYYRGFHWIRSETGEMELASGILYLDSLGLIYEKTDNLLEVFRQPIGNAVHPYYFINGALIESEKSYNEFLSTHNKSQQDYSLNYSFYLSQVSRYAIINRPNDSTTTYSTIRRRFFLKGKKAHTSIQPLFSDRTYVYKDGWLVSINSKRNEKVLLEYNTDLFEGLSADNKKKLEALWAYMNRHWNTVQQVYDDAPSEVMEAIGLYVTDIYADDMKELKGDEYLKAYKDLIKTFIEETVESKFTLAENMDAGSSEAYEYLKDAYLQWEDIVEWEDIEEDKSLKEVNSFLEKEAPKLKQLSNTISSMPYSNDVGDTLKGVLKTIEDCENYARLSEENKKDVLKRVKNLRTSNI